MGIFEVDDMAGLDVARRAAAAGGRRALRNGALRAENGKRGGMSTGRTASRSPTRVLRLIRRVANEAGIPQKEFNDEEIVERALYGLINEGAKILAEGYALRASDIDFVYLNGYGFPGW